MAKRKAETPSNGDGPPAAKKAATAARSVQSSFAPSLFSDKFKSQYKDAYASSSPYKHAVVAPLVADDLLRAVRKEVIEHVNFTPKETDIYKIHQSGDLANLSALESSALKKLPSLLTLRDSLYSPEFRSWIAEVAGSGPLSGKKTDMAINVYVPGCHLLCHDDVIGTRRVSYILYLTDPDKPWKPLWGGALRLHATDEVKGEDGKTYKMPRAEWEKSIPPAWNQLSFFTVQPGESFHDVEEVYHRLDTEQEDDGGRVRMAISGWFHIPQEGEEGYEQGLAEKLAERSSLAQLQGKADQLDEPQPTWIDPAKHMSDGAQPNQEDLELSEEDLQFLIAYITPDYLVPDTVEKMNEVFAEESTLPLTDFLSKKFSARLKAQLSSPSPKFSHPWKISRPPHKHRFEYMSVNTHDAVSDIGADDAYTDLLHNLLPSLAFRKWLSLVTGLDLRRSSILGRHYRKGLDYELAQEYNGDAPQLEYTLCMTPSEGWAPDEDEDLDESDNVGGYELFMAGEELDDHPVSNKSSNHNATQTGAGNRRSAKTADPAVYQEAQDGEDDGILFSNPASWNTLSLVLRDQGVLRFVKYVSRAAKGDRWDITGAYEVDDQDDTADSEVEFTGFCD